MTNPSSGYIRVLARELGVDVSRNMHDLDVALQILDSIPGSKNSAVDLVSKGPRDNRHMLVWHMPKKFGGRDYEVRAGTFIGCVIKLGNHYKGLLREREEKESEV